MKLSNLLCKSRAGWNLSAQIIIFFLFLGFTSSALAQSYSGPLVITKGGTYSGNWESRNSEEAAVEIRTSEPVIIENSSIRGAGYLIKSWGYSANLTVRHTKGYGLTPTPYSNYKKPRRFVTLNNFQNLVVENCYLESTAGIYAGTRYEGDGSTKETIRIRYNIVKNIDGRVYGGAKEHSQFVQFNFKGAIRNAEIAWNEVMNEADKSLVEDNINIYNTRGTIDSPIRIHNNYIQGAFPFSANGTQYSGGGIITDGDAGINDCPAFIEAFENHLVGLGNYSMGIAGGNNIRYHHNRAINAATFSNGSKYNMYTSGLWSKDYYHLNTTFANSIDNNVVGIVAWGYKDNRNDVSVAQNADFKNNTHLPNPITVQSEKDELGRWQQKLQRHSVKLGPGGSGTTAPANLQPKISFTSPSDNATFVLGANIPLVANATDADGSIAKVEFYLGTAKIGEALRAPYTFTWSKATAGTHRLTAKAFDNQGASAQSAAINVQVSVQTSIATPTLTQAPAGTGSITREFWAGVHSSDLSKIPTASTPGSQTTLSLFEAPSNVGDNYGQRIRGYVTAPVSGQYTFWIASDDKAELYLSTSEEAGAKRRIAFVESWTNSREWDKHASQQSARVSLEAGKRYYIEALHLEGGGGDNLAVGWQLPNGTMERPIAGNRLSPMGTINVTTTPIASVSTGSYTAGSIIREFWEGVHSHNVKDIPVSKAPNKTSQLALFEAPSNVGDNYGQRIRG
ncbi:Ig-like domain-containing protein, partial [Pontibacter sp. CAU 1760]